MLLTCHPSILEERTKTTNFCLRSVAGVVSVTDFDSLDAKIYVRTENNELHVFALNETVIYLKYEDFIIGIGKE